METKHRSYIRVKIRQKDDRTFHRIKRMALMAGGHTVSMHAARSAMGVRKTGTSLFIFPSEEKAKEFKKNLATQVSISKASAEDSDGTY